MMRNQAHDGAGCPAYRQGIGCWEVDWKDLVQRLPSGQQEYWRYFFEKCPGCEAFTAHPEEMRSRIAEVNRLF
jgi:hypothetical protein